MEDMICVKSFTVAVYIPAVIEKDGKREVVEAEALEQASKEFASELDELNFPGMMKATGQSMAEEQFLRFHPIVEVTGE